MVVLHLRVIAMGYWKYKASNINGEHVEGVATGDDPEDIAVDFLRAGVQIYHIVPMTTAEYNRVKSVEKKIARLRRLQALASAPKESKNTVRPTHWAARRAMLRRRKLPVMTLIVVAVVIIIGVTILAVAQ